LLKPVPRQDSRFVVQIVDLPFAGDARGIACIAQESGKSDLAFWIEPAATVQCCVVMQAKTCAMGIAAREQNRATRPTDRRRIAVLDPHARPRQAVNIRRTSLLASITTNPLLAHVVQQTENNVRPRLILGPCRLTQ